MDEFDPVYLAVDTFSSDASVGQHRLDCPAPECRSRKKRNQKSLSIQVSADGVVWNCWHCGTTGTLKNEDNVVPIDRANPTTKKQKMVRTALTDDALAFLERRGISRETAELYKVFSADRYIASMGAEVPCIGFPYFQNDKAYAAKIRSLEGKGFSQQGAAASFFGLEHVSKGDDLIIVEGELDVLACAEAGVTAISIPNGAPLKVSEDRVDPSEDNKFRYVWAAKEYIDAAERIIIAVDNDAPGEVLAEELARRVGKQQCWQVVWDVKDANDLLVAGGKQAVLDAILRAEAWPVSGLYDASFFIDQVDDLYERGLGRGALTGLPDLDDNYTIMPGQLTVVTGIPSSGKSEFVDQLMVNLAETRDWRFAVASFENEPRLHMAKLLSKKMRKPFFESRFGRMSAEEKDEGMTWVGDHFTFIHQSDGSMATIDSILERATVAVMRYGCRGLVIDPYNYIARRADLEHQEISDMLTKVQMWAKAHDAHVWFVAHPAKLTRDVKVPKGYEISGSASWFSKCDCGVTVHRPDPIETPRDVEIHVWKMRFSWVGTQGVSELKYDLATTRYHEDYQDPTWDLPKLTGSDPWL